MRDYAGSHSEAAFAELVRRHIDLVYSAALRMVCDSHQAEDVTQGVFVALAQNARQLTDHPVLSGWLHRTTQNLAANAVRTNVRRQTREQEAAAMNELLSAEARWEQIEPELDAALGELDEADRDALLLRYFEKKSAQEMAKRLGISAEAAQKRVSRAVERLREFFAKRGVTVGTGALAVVITANAVHAAPAGLAATISVAAALTGAGISTSTIITTTKTIAMTTFQKTVVAATVAVLAGTGIYEFHQNSKLRDQIQTLQQQQAPLAGQMQQLQRERDEATKNLAAAQREIGQARGDHDELLRLRGQVAATRQRQPAAAGSEAKANTAKAQSLAESPSIQFTPSADWKNVGNASPADAFQTLLWASLNRDTNALIKSLVWDTTAKAKLDALFAAAPEAVRQKFGSVDGLIFENLNNTPMAGFRVVSVSTQGDEATLLEEHQYEGGRVRQNSFTLHRQDDGWRIVLDENRLEKLGAYLSSLASQNVK